VVIGNPNAGDGIETVTPDYLICLEDGKHFRSLRRHLTVLGLTPEQYREKWRLPADYPMVAPNYAAQRSAMAKSMGFGQTRRMAGAGKKGRSPKPAA
jgi:MucR family transcriptional regulator, transcriptional regulator of exopolysaccharide biosynthesis